MSAVLHRLTIIPIQAWRQPLLHLALVVAALLWMYQGTLLAMIGIWNRSETFAHCFLVLPISLWLAWRERQSLRLLVPAPQPWVLLPMLGAASVWLLGEMASVNAATQFALVALLVLSVPLVLGLPPARRLAFPLAFLFFMVPFGEFLMPMMMDRTADFTVLALQMSGIPVYREGLHFVIPSGNWSVVEACSGVRYLIASFMVGSLFAYLNYSSTRRRLIFCAVSLIVPLVANWIRAYLIVMLGHLSGNTLAVGVDHLIYGWVFFGIVIMVMFMIGARWSEPPAVVQQAPAGPAAPGAWGNVQGSVGVVALALLVLAAPHALNWRLSAAAGSGSAPAFVLAPLPGPQADIGLLPFEPIFENPSSTSIRRYAMGDASVLVHVAYYRQQRYGGKMVSSQNSLLASNDPQWQLGSATTAMHAIGGERVAWRAAEIVQSATAPRDGARRRLDVRQIFWIDGKLSASNARAVAYGVLGKLLGRGDEGAVITVFTEGPVARETGAVLDLFLRQHFAAMESQLAAYRDRH